MRDLLPTTTTKDEESRDAQVAVLPIGSFEQHGEFLPLITDTVVACAITGEIAERYPVQILPPVTISCSHEHSAWRGTASISARTLHAVVNDVYTSVTRNGPSALVLVNGHGGNYVLANVVQEATAEGKHMALFPQPADWTEARQAAGLVTDQHEDMHAGELETSILLHAAPELVHDGYQTADHTADDRRHLHTLGMQAYTENGVIGRPSLGTAAKGATVLATLACGFAGLLAELD